MLPSRRQATFIALSGSTINTAIVSVQAIILIPLYLHYIGTRVFGAWLASGDVLVWLQAFDLGLPNMMIQRIGIAHGGNDPRKVGEYCATGMVVMAVVSMLIGLLAWIVSYFLPGWMGLSGEEAETLSACFRLGSVASVVTLFNYSIVGFSRGIQKTGLMNVTLIGSGLAGFGISLVLLFQGYGLWSIPAGLVTRAAFSLLGSAIFMASVYRTQLGGHFRFSYPAAREMASASPITAAGGLSYAVMNQSEGALIGFVLRPELVPSYTLTRKGADVLGSLLNTIGFASYGGFAHLIGSAQRHRAWRVLAEITSLRYSLSIAGAAAFMALNPSFVTLWVGPEMYGGHWLTILMALQMILAGGAYLMNYLYRACGPIVKGSVALVVESLIRVPLMIVLLRWLGVLGIPLAAILTSVVATFVAYLWAQRELSQYAARVRLFSQRVEWARIGVLMVGTAACVWLRGPSWPFVLCTGTAVALAAATLLISIDPLLGDLRRSMRSVMLGWTAGLG